MGIEIFKYNLLIVCFFLASTGITKAQDSTRFIHENDTTIGIPITKTAFDEKVSGYVKLMSDWTKFTPEDYVEMIRLYNTIGNSNLIKADYYRMYYQIFMVMYLKDVGKTLNVELMKGMSLYSKKYNIWIGDRPFGNSNSEFRITN